MKKRITVTLSPEVVKHAKIQAVKDDTNLSALIEKLLRTWLENTEDIGNDIRATRT